MKHEIYFRLAVLVVVSSYSLAAIDWEINSGNETMGGTEEYRNIFVYNSASLDVSGGIATSINSYNTSIINITNGNVNSVVSGGSSTTIYGGTIGSIQSSGTASTYLYGVDNNPTLTYTENGYIHIYGYDFEYTRAGGASESGWLSGYWEDGNSFDLYLRNLPVPFDSSNVITHVVPEPSIILLMGLGSVCLRKKKIDCLD